jgi:copper(I)-binding protein
MLLLPLIAACGADDDPALLSASDLTVLAPLPGQESVVAYLTLENNGSMPLVISLVTSPEFATVEMHATVFGEGMAEMILIDAITVAEDSAVEFSMGNRHLMLMDPVESLAPGDDVTLEFHYGGNDLLSVRAPLEPRTPGDR